MHGGGTMDSSHAHGTGGIARITLFALFALLALGGSACDDDASGGEGGAGGSGSGGSGGTGSVAVVGPGPSVTTGGGEETPARTPGQICSEACACDATCSVQAESYVAACQARFSDDAVAATLAGCEAEYDAYFLCYSNHWTCSATQVCDEVAEAFGTCVGRLCEAADELCGCFGCSSDCRGGEQRCYAACIVEAGSCDGEGDAYWTCVEGCYQGEVGTSGAGGFDG